MKNSVWNSDKAFQLWQYTVSHSQLVLQSTSGDDEVIRVYFENVDRLEVSRFYRAPFSLKTVDSHSPYPEALKSPDLLFELSSPEAEGFVVASRVRITRNSRQGAEKELLFHESIANQPHGGD
ncbi:hypothetical protein [Amycolatopsis decaplanina]|uniref:Uncharacterized protein n=1 Tax=Amycolatopsis decaplanina DSM 44594 TaxID=1284240 RepID=M2YRW7_9PSEU|nr:hypothetical protein [Amycolatopsis decaplanina]EME64665.1 hypothetical protein H074_01977 [Amycolatopsis decaplanina DSM 44594]